jgi:putative membrane protein
MASDSTISPPLGGPIRDHPLATTVLLSIVGYALVIGTFSGVVPAAVFPDLTIEQVNRLADAIAVVNTVATLTLLSGWYWIRQDEVTKHRIAMGTGFGLILLFLVLYLTKIGGGGTKEFVGPTLPYYAYLGMLAIHILLSIVAVPVVLYALVLGLTHTPRELRTETPHRRIGRIAAGAWILSLALGVVTYLLLNHVYAWEFVEAGVVLSLAAIPRRWRRPST